MLTADYSASLFAPLGHIILFPSQPALIFLLNDACLAEKQQIPFFLVFGLTRRGLELTIYRTQGEHANHYVTDVVQS
jgi:hypothetical protein